MLEILPIINIDDNDLFIKMDKGGMWHCTFSFFTSYYPSHSTLVYRTTYLIKGKSPIHHLIAEDKESALRMLYRFDDKQIPDILMSIDSDFEAVISRGGSDTISQFMHKLDVAELLGLYLETADNRLFSHFQEICSKSQEMMTKLLLCKDELNVRAHDGTTFCIKLLQSDEVTEFNWLTFHISRLEPEQIIAVLNQTDYKGNTALHKIGKESLSGEAFVKWKGLLSLCPDDVLREYITRQNFHGVSGFDNASSRICNKETADGQLMFGDDWKRGYRFERAAKRCIESRQWLVWTKRFLRTMKSEFFDMVELLVPMFYVAANNYDVMLAELILSKIERNKKNVNTFLTTRATDEQSTVFHFAANHKTIGMMQILVELAQSANLDLFELLSMKSENGLDDTPLMVAVKRGRIRIIKYLLSVVPERATELILMTTEFSVPLRMNNFFKRNQHVIVRNAVIWALETYSNQERHRRDLTVLKFLIEKLPFKQLLELLTYSNAMDETIYHYVLTKELCEYFEDDLGVNFSMKMWGMQDSDGVTPLMRAMAIYERNHSMMINTELEQKDNEENEMAQKITTENVKTNDEAVEFLQWILHKCCINNDQRFWLIYRTAGDGENILDKTSGAVQRFLIDEVESMLIDREEFNLEAVIPIWLFALKNSNIDLAQRLMDLVHDDSDRLELVGCRNEFGCSPILAAAQSGNLKTLRFLEDQCLMHLQNFIEHKDHKQRTVMHYAVISGSREMVKNVLSLYMDAADVVQPLQYGDLMIGGTVGGLKDEMGNTPFSYFLKENASEEMTLYLLNRFDDKSREDQRKRDTAVTSASGTRSKRKVTLAAEEAPFAAQEYQSQSSSGSLAQNIDDKVAMLFAKNKNEEIPLIEEYAVDMNMPMDIVSDFVYQFIISIKEVLTRNFIPCLFSSHFTAQY